MIQNQIYLLLRIKVVLCVRMCLADLNINLDLTFRKINRTVTWRSAGQESGMKTEELSELNIWIF